MINDKITWEDALRNPSLLSIGKHGFSCNTDSTDFVVELRFDLGEEEAEKETKGGEGKYEYDEEEDDEDDNGDGEDEVDDAENDEDDDEDEDELTEESHALMQTSHSSSTIFSQPHASHSRTRQSLTAASVMTCLQSGHFMGCPRSSKTRSQPYMHFR